MVVSAVYGQWIEPWQLRPAPDSSYIIGARNPYFDGEWIKFGALDSLYGSKDSLFMRNDTIFLRDGKGFAKVVSTGGGDGYIHDLYPYSTGFVLDNPTVPLQDTVIFDYAASGTGSFVPASNYIAGTGINITGNTISSTVVNTDAQAISKSGNVISITGNASTVNIANDTPAEGEVLTFTAGEWVASAASGGASLTGNEAIRSTNLNLSTSYQDLVSLSLASGTYVLNANAAALILSGSVEVQLWNSTTSTSLGVTSVNATQSSVSINRIVTLSGTNTIILRAKGPTGNSIQGGNNGATGFTALKIQ